MLNEPRDADNGSVGAVRRAKSVANKNAVAKSGKLPGKSLVVLFFVGMEADVFQNEDFAVAQRLALTFRAGADAIQGESHRLAEKLFEFLGGGAQRIFWIWSAFGAP